MSGFTLTRHDVSSKISYVYGIKQKQSAFLLKTIVGEICSLIFERGTLKVSSFGVFHVREKKQRIGRNPKTGASAIISERKVLTFKGSQILKKRLWKIRSSTDKKPMSSLNFSQPQSSL